MTLTANSTNHQLRQPKILTALPGPNAASILNEDKQLLSPSYPRPYPLVPKSGQGLWLTDVDGNEFLDFMAGIAVSSTGYNHPHVTSAVQEQAARYMHVCLSDFPQPESVRLARRLSKLSGGNQRVFFCNSGAEALEGAVKLAKHKTGRSHIISTFGSFHGRTMGALALTASRAVYRKGFGTLPNVTHVPYPNPYRPALGANSKNVGSVVLEYLEKNIFAHIVDPSEVAAIVLEPMQGEGGYIVPPDDFLPGVRKLCDAHGILLILDEVQTGMGRTGKFYAHQHWDVRADIICLAKGLASGLPLGAIIAHEQIMDWPVGAHGSTFGGNPVATAAANATLDLLLGTENDTCPDCTCNPSHECKHGLINNAASIGGRMLQQLQDLKTKHACIGDVRGKGLFIGIEFVNANGQPDATRRDKISQHAFKLGLLTLGCGPSTLRLCPALSINQDEADVGLAILAKAIELSN